MVAAKQLVLQRQKEQIEILNLIGKATSENGGSFHYFRPYKRIVRSGKNMEVGKEAQPRCGQVAEDISAYPLKKLSQLQQNGTVVLLNQNNAVLAFGKRMPGFDNMPPKR